MSVTIAIMDPAENTLWRRVVDLPWHGIATFQMPLSLEPPLGTWHVRVSRTTGGEALVSGEFDVARYVLPPFGVELTVPGVITRDDDGGALPGV